MIDAAQPTFLVATEEQRSATMSTVSPNESYAVFRVTKED
jgi:hypothetical protein